MILVLTLDDATGREIALLVQQESVMVLRVKRHMIYLFLLHNLIGMVLETTNTDLRLVETKKCEQKLHEVIILTRLE
jgi:hypothetical protein